MSVRYLISLDQAARRLGCQPGFVLRLAEKYPKQLRTEIVDGSRWFWPGDVDSLRADVRAVLQPALEGRS